MLIPFMVSWYFAPKKLQTDEIWLSEQLKRLLDVEIGDEVELGQTLLRVGMY